MTTAPLLVAPTGVGHRCVGGTHSHLADGRLVCWQPGPLLRGRRHAVDAELLGQAVPPALARRAAGLPPARVWWLWTRAEARAKVLDVPILVWISRVDWLDDAAHPRGGAYDETAVLTRHLGDLVVSQAVRPPARP